MVTPLTNEDFSLEAVMAAVRLRVETKRVRTPGLPDLQQPLCVRRCD